MDAHKRVKKTSRHAVWRDASEKFFTIWLPGERCQNDVLIPIMKGYV